MKEQKKDMKNNSNKRYFEGRLLGDLMFEVTQLVLEMGEDSDSGDIKIIPSHPKPFCLGWMFYLDGYLVCQIFLEAQDKAHGMDNLSWLEWYDTRDGDFLEDHYVPTFGFPEWVETEEDEDLFLSGVWNKYM